MIGRARDCARGLRSATVGIVSGSAVVNNGRKVASNRAMPRALVIAIVIVLGLVARTTAAHADNVDTLIKDLRSGSDYKVRLSAVLALAKLGDARAIDPLIGALSDSDKTVRGAAAVTLGKLVDASTPTATRTKLVTALDRLIARETTASVKTQATKTKQIVAALGAPAVAVAKGGIFVDVGLMAAVPKLAEPVDAMKALMRKTTQTVLTRKAGDMMQTWSTGKTPTKPQLEAKGVKGFQVDGTVNEVSVKQKGSTATVSCKVSMLIASFPNPSIFAVLSGGAAVQGSNDPRDIELGKVDCVAAVVEDLVASKVVSAIRTKASQ